MNKKMMIALAVIAAVVLAAAGALGVMSATGDDAMQEEVILIEENADGSSEEMLEQEAEAEMETEEEFEVAEIYGTVIEVTDAYIVMETTEAGLVQANISDDTIMEGAEAFEIGQVVKVIYDGKMTRSIPTQISAMLIGVYSVSGEVTEIADGSITVKLADSQQDVILTLPQDAPEFHEGDVITAYTTGVSTMSLPPQMNAVAIFK